MKKARKPLCLRAFLYAFWVCLKKNLKIFQKNTKNLLTKQVMQCIVQTSQKKPTNHVGDEGNVKGEIVMIKIYSKLTVANIKNQRMCFRCYM